MCGDIWLAIEDLVQSQETVQGAAARRILAAGEEGILALREAALGDRRDVAMESARILSELDYPQHFEIMCELLHAPNPLISLAGVKGLERHGEKAIEPLTKALSNGHALIQGSVLGVLERLGTHLVVAALMNLLAAADVPMLRYSVIATLGRLGDPVAIPLIQSFKDDLDYHVREHVAIALERLGT